MTTVSMQTVEKIAEEAYVYSFPMMMGYRFAYASFLFSGSPSYQGPPNAIYGKAATLDYNFRDVVTPNADTPYSMALLDLRAEPVVIRIPPVTDRYYVFQFVDLFGTNPHYIGTRTRGTRGGTYLAIKSGWKGEINEKIDDILPFETDFVFVIGRTQLFGADDVPALSAVMNGYQVQTLSDYRHKTGAAAKPVQWLPWNDDASRDERFIGYLNQLLSFCQPVHPTEINLMQRFSSIGISPGAIFDPGSVNNETKLAIRSGIAIAREMIAESGQNMSRKVNGWASSDAFGTREWYQGDYLLRAAAAMAGWGGNDTIEAMYPITRDDSTGEQFSGTNRYQLTFTDMPPARAFWSVTMYDTSYDGTAGYLVKNPIDRYLINSTTENLARNDDGSLTICIQRTQPGDSKQRANWLPSPEGPFYLVLRMYLPEQAALSGDWTPPPVFKM